MPACTGEDVLSLCSSECQEKCNESENFARTRAIILPRGENRDSDVFLTYPGN